MASLEVLDEAAALDTASVQGPQHAYDLIHAALKATLTPVEKDSDEWTLIKKFMSNGSMLDVVDIFRIDRQGETGRFQPFRRLPNRTLLCHGTRVANAIGIMRCRIPSLSHC